MIQSCSLTSFFFFFNDTATTEIYTLSLHDALPIWRRKTNDRMPPDTVPRMTARNERDSRRPFPRDNRCGWRISGMRSEEHTSELQSRQYLVCRLLLEKKKKTKKQKYIKITMNN